MKEFEGKTVLVTGAGSGIGKASALAFAGQGARVAIADIDQQNGIATVEEIRATGADAEFFAVDIADEASIQAVVAGVVDRFGSLDVAHNNAGIDTPTLDLLNTSKELWDRTIAVNLTGVFNSLRAEIAYMVEHGGGTIVNTASISGLIGTYNHSAYAAAKFGVVGLTKAAAAEYITRGVRINSVAPGPVETPFMSALPDHVRHAFEQGAPIERMARPEEIADAVLWLASPRSSYVVGITMPVDGGTAGTSMATRAVVG